MNPFSVYVLYSEMHKRYYIGQTDNVELRLIRHSKGYEKSTSPYVPWALVCCINKPTRGETMILEKKLKNLNSDDLKKFIGKYGIEGRGA